MKTSAGQRRDRTHTITPDRKYTPTPASNSFVALASDSETDSSIAEEAFLPSPTIYSSDSDSSTDMSAISENKGNNLTATILQELMESLDPGCTTTKVKFTYADISNFQTNMGNALTRVTAPYEQYGYSFLADTDETYFVRANKIPPSMPTMPNKPDYSNKAQVKTVKRALKHYQACAKVKACGIKLLEQCFPECLWLLKTDQGLPWTRHSRQR